ncbi:MAG: EAL domain-containing protein [Rhodocyclaceae bacterium]
MKLNPSLKAYGIRQGLSVALMLLGLWVILGWLVRSAVMVQMMPGLVAMVINTASCFALSGLALFCCGRDTPRARRLVVLLSSVVFVVGTLILIENLADVGNHFDWAGLHDWLKDGNPHPGRMAPNTSLGFVCAAIALFMTRYLRDRRVAWLAIVLSFVVLTLGVTGLIGYSLKLDALYSWFKGSRMALHTASGMITLGLGLMLASIELSQRHESLAPDQRISLIGSLTLVLVSLSTGLAGFVALQERTKEEITHGLQVALRGRLVHLQSALNEAYDRTPPLAAILEPSSELAGALKGPAGLPALTRLLERRRAASKFLWIRVNRPDGSRLVEVGQAADPASVAIRLKNVESEVLWDQAYQLRTSWPLFNADGQLIATLKVMRALPALNKLFLDDTGFGTTGETGLCGLVDAQTMQCMPQRRQLKPYNARVMLAAGEATPTSMALSGKQGIHFGKDYRGNQVIAAYSYVGDTGLGTAVKQDAWEIFQPISDQLKRVIPILLLLTAAGILLLHSQVRPLARRLVRSEAAMREANLALADEEQRIRAVLDNIGDGILTMDHEGFIRSVNPAACHIFGYGQDELIGVEMAQLMPVALRDMHRAGLKRYLAQGNARVVNKGAVELTGLRKDDTEFPLELSVTQVDDHGQILFVGIVRDISERAAAQKALHDEKERLRVTLHSIGDAVITTDTQGKVLYLNPVAQEMTGWPKDEAQGRAIEEVFHIINDKTGERAVNPVELVLATGDISGLAENTELIRRDGRHIAIEDSAAPIRGQDGYVSGVVIVFHDVTQARQLAEQISYQASHDALTDLVNRREFERRVSAALYKADSSLTPDSKGTALFYLDLDQFKIVNDTCGHAAGDQLLIQVSELIRNQLRSEDTLARLGGDEFAILLENCPPSVAERVAEKVRRAVKEFQFLWQDKTFGIGVSIGVVSRRGDQPLGELLRAADSACYVAKEKGRNLVHVYREEDADLVRRNGEMGWVARIEQALRDDRFQLYLQPIVPNDWKPGERHEHYEVLVRMRDPSGTLIPPNAFIPAAERYGLMPAVDRWIVEHALELLASRGEDAPRLSLSINLSGTSINQDGFLPFVVEQINRTQPPVGTICFEITETAAIGNLTAFGRMMHELKALGCLFSLDDFGSGMSSFAYLKHLPVDYVKIDGAFVKDIEDDLTDRAMVEAINNIAHVMGIRTVAEFVENEGIRRQLDAIGVDFLQGYGIGHPRPASEVLEADAQQFATTSAI